MLIPMETYRTCDFPGVVWTHCPHSGSANDILVHTRLETKSTYGSVIELDDKNEGVCDLSLRRRRRLRRYKHQQQHRRVSKIKVNGIPIPRPNISSNWSENTIEL